MTISPETCSHWTDAKIRFERMPFNKPWREYQIICGRCQASKSLSSWDEIESLIRDGFLLRGKEKAREFFGVNK